MPELKITDDELIALKEQGLSNINIAKKYDITRQAVDSRVKKLALKGYSPTHNMTHTVPDGYKVKGISTLYDKDGKPSIQWVKSCEDRERQLELIQEMCRGFTDTLPKYDIPDATDLDEKNNNCLAVYPVGDPHIGMLSWGEETGEDWDLSIAERKMGEVFNSLVSSVPKCNTAVLALLGDNFHYDNIAGVTTRSGNVLDRDSRYSKMVRVGIRIIRAMIDRLLLQHNNVHVIVSRGNHDDATSIFLREALYHIYQDTDRVSVDNSPTMFHYYKFGVNLLGFHHGDTCKMERLPGVMACDRAADWGNTKYRHWLTGHIHKNMIKDEHMGCIVESFNIMAPMDAYAYSGGWRSGRNTQCLLYDYTDGPKGRRIENL